MYGDNYDPNTGMPKSLSSKDEEKTDTVKNKGGYNNHMREVFQELGIPF